MGKMGRLQSRSQEIPRVFQRLFSVSFQVVEIWIQHFLINVIVNCNVSLGAVVGSGTPGANVTTKRSQLKMRRISLVIHPRWVFWRKWWKEWKLLRLILTSREWQITVRMAIHQYIGNYIWPQRRGDLPCIFKTVAIGVFRECLMLGTRSCMLNYC